MRKYTIWFLLVMMLLSSGISPVAFSQADEPQPTMASATVDIESPAFQHSFSVGDIQPSMANCIGSCPEFGHDGKFLRNDAAAFGEGRALVTALDAQTLSQRSFTVAARIKADDWNSGFHAVLGAHDAQGFILGMLDGRPYMNFGGNGMSGQTKLLPNKWYMVGWRYDMERGEMAISVDGVIEKIVARKPALSASGALLIGAAGTASFPGVIDDLRIYNRALTSLELVKLTEYNPAAYGVEAGTADLADESGLIVRDMTISLNCEPPDREWYNMAIRYWADAVYEMTDGRHWLGKVSVYTQSARWGRTHVWFHCNEPGRSNAHWAGRPLADRGNRIQMFKEATAQATGYVLGHEDMHYSYGLLDEYREWFKFSSTDPGEPIQWDTPVPYSIMNDAAPANGFTPCVEFYPWWQFWNWGKCAKYSAVSHDGDNRWLNFSSPANDTRNTAQFRVLQASGWGTLGRSVFDDPLWRNVRPRTNVPNGDLIDYGRSLTGMAPVNLRPDRLESRKHLQIVWMGAQEGVAATDAVQSLSASGAIREYLVDTSAAMAGDKLAVVQQVLTQRIDAALDGDAIGILSFDGTVIERHPLVTINAASRATLKTVVANLAVGGADVATGDALAAGFDALTASGVPTTTVRALYLIGSGATTTGQLPANVQAALVNENISLYAFGYDAAEAEAIGLTEIADATYGLYTDVAGARDLQTALQTADRYSALTQYTGVRTGYEDLAVGATRSYAVLIDAGLNLLDYVVWVGAAPGEAEIAIVKPDSSRVVLDGDACEDWSEPGNPAMVCYLQVDAVLGQWAIEVANQTGAESWVSYYVDAYALQGTSTYMAETMSLTGDTVQYPAPMVVNAWVQKDLAVAGANLKAEVNAPDGSYMEFALRDDGIVPDKLANDGHYAAYVDYWTDGEYYISAQYDNDNNDAYFTNLGITDQITLTATLVGENFHRYGETWISVVGWQADDHANNTGAESTALTPDNTFVAGRIDRAGDVDTFRVDPAAIGVAPDDELFLRVNRLGLEMDPYVQILNENGDLLHEAYFEFNPDSDAFLFVPLTMTTSSEVYYLALQHYDEEAETGVYEISIGPRHAGDPWPDTPVGFTSGQAEPYTAYFKPVAPGGTVDFTHQFTNTGTVAATFDITAKVFEGWPVTLKAGDLSISGSGEITLTLPAIAPGSTFAYQVLVTPPADVAKGTTTDVLVMVNSQSAAWLSASAIDKVAVGDVRPAEVFIPIVRR